MLFLFYAWVEGGSKPLYHFHVTFYYTNYDLYCIPALLVAGIKITKRGFEQRRYFRL